MTTTDARENWQIGHLASLDKDALRALFSTLDAPEPGEIRGEYAGHDYYGQTAESFAAALERVTAGAGGFWLGKGFPGEEGDGANGYNRIYRPAEGTTQRRDRFGIHRGPSPIDGRPTLLLKYSDYDTPAGGIGFLDEIRRVNENLFLCTGTPDEGTGEVGFFFLTGPAAPFMGVDDPESELLPADASR